MVVKPSWKDMALEHVNVSEYITAMMKKQVYHICFLLMCFIYSCMGVSRPRQRCIFIMQSIITISWYVPEIRQTLITICSFTDVIRDTHLCIIECLSKTVSYTRTAWCENVACVYLCLLEHVHVLLLNVLQRSS